jgi:hypothetical protein
LAVLLPNQTYRDLKDRQQLIVYRGKVERGSSEYRKIEEILSNSVRIWGEVSPRYRSRICFPSSNLNLNH